jgi:hypothetical protein
MMARDLCDTCNDSGYALQYGVLYRCHCAAGDSLADQIYAPSDKQKLYPIRMPRLSKPKLVGREAAAGKDE